MFGRSLGPVDRLIEKATSQLLLEPDWDSILQICDAIRQGDVKPYYVLLALQRKWTAENPHVSLFAYEVLESIVKNCGPIVHDHVATEEFMEFMKKQAKERVDEVKAKVLELIQVWSHAFRNEPQYKVVQDTYNLMKMEGYTFPTLKESDAMFCAEKAPEWKDGECCNRCRVQFSMVQRKHHCRNCGEIFCGKCSSRSSIIPKFGIEREVRVCEACFNGLNKSVKKSDEDELPSEYLASPLSTQPQNPTQKSDAEIQEEEDIQLAIALSKSEAETKEKEKKRTSYTYTGGSNNHTESSPSLSQQNQVNAPVLDTSDMDPELARYLNRKYWEQKQDEPSTTQPSAPTVGSAEPRTSHSTMRVQEKFQNGEVNEEQQFLGALQSSLEIFVNRMKSNSQRGRAIANDSSVQSLFMTINAMHPQLTKYVGEQEDARAHYENLQDKLAQMKDAREALDALRDEHQAKRRRELEDLERQRQIQMAAKLQVMRQKKQEYLEYQRQLAFQRMQEHEREMQMRFEQQKHMQHMRAMQTYYPQMYVQQQGFSPVGSAEGSPLHQPHMVSMPYQSMPGQPGVMPQGVPPGVMPQGSLPPGGVPMEGAPGVPYVQPEMMGAPGMLPNQQSYIPQNIPQEGMALPAGYSPNMAQNPNKNMQNVPYNPADGSQPPPNYVYNMQGMVNALPGQNPPNMQNYNPSGPPQGYVEMGVPQYPGQQPPGIPGQPGMPAAPNGQQAPPENQPASQLISFD